MRWLRIPTFSLKTLGYFMKMIFALNILYWDEYCLISSSAK